MKTARRATDLDEQIGAALRRLRSTRYVSGPALAKMLGLSYQQLQKYEAGRDRIPAGRLKALADALGVPIAAFFSGIPSDAVHRIVDETRSLSHLVQGDTAMLCTLRELLQAYVSIKSPRRRASVLAMMSALAAPASGAGDD